MTSWLNKQRKQTLLDLSSEAGLRADEEARKDELVENLDTHLQANATRLARNSSFAPYFDTRRTPFKARSSAAGVTSDDGEVKSVVKARGRRTTKVKQETDEEEAANQSPSQALVPTSSAATKTPGRPRRRSELPPSPADVADDVEYAATRFYSGLDNMYNVSGIPETIERLQEICSSLTSVHMTVLALEAWALQRQILPFKYAYDIPSTMLLGRNTPHIPIMLPDLFRLVTPEFWSTSLLWASTSIFIPLLFAYFYNLSTRDVKRHGARVTVARYIADPLTFNVAKAIMTYIIYGKGYYFGFSLPDVAMRVDHAMFGGYNGIMIGSYVGMLVSLYEAAQRK